MSLLDFLFYFFPSLLTFSARAINRHTPERAVQVAGGRLLAFHHWVLGSIAAVGMWGGYGLFSKVSDTFVDFHHQ